MVTNLPYSVKALPKIAQSRNPPGGRSSIVFGQDTTSYQTTSQTPPVTSSPTPSPRRAARPISNIFGGDALATPPTTPPKRQYGGLKNQSSLVFGDDSVANVTEKIAKVAVKDGNDAEAVAAGVSRGREEPAEQRRHLRPAGGVSSVNFAWDENPQPTSQPLHSSKKMIPQQQQEERQHRPGKRLLGSPGQRSSIVFASPGADAVDWQRPRSVSTPVPPVEESEPVTSPVEEDKLTPPATPTPEVATTPEEPPETPTTPAATAPDRKRNTHFRSSVVFGDDDPNPPDFSPRKHKPGRRLLSPPGGGGPATIMDLVGGSTDAESPRAARSARIDPATMEVAGYTTGKHRVY
ncbi:hypothetical protein HK104_003194 [Borealophlyctis nickersoniae]|nr:hypothetical protein HK104_003194 [Borealophlyctis nickersoniae]